MKRAINDYLNAKCSYYRLIAINVWILMNILQILVESNVVPFTSTGIEWLMHPLNITELALFFVIVFIFDYSNIDYDSTKANPNSFVMRRKAKFSNIYCALAIGLLALIASILGGVLLPGLPTKSVETLALWLSLLGLEFILASSVLAGSKMKYQLRIGSGNG